jgi:cellulose synthase operon protein C
VTENGDAEFRSLLDEVVSGALTMMDLGAVTPETVRTLGPRESGLAQRRSSFGRWHVAAAVLSTFDRVALKPAADLAGLGDDDMMSLLADSTPVVDALGNTGWKLLVDVRRDILRVLGGPRAIRQALSANPDRSRDDPVQRIFEGYVDGAAPPLARQSVVQVAATFEVAQWLDGLNLQLGSPIPGLEAIRARSDYLTLLQPFDELAGANFAGRTEELQELRDYVGVLPPGSMRGRVARAVRKVFRLRENPPIVIYGPGGMGKSALIARFIGEHATTPDASFPFVYLDFDRVSLRAEEPLTLLAEAVRQLGLQYAETRVYAERVRSRLQSVLIGYSADPGGAGGSQSGASGDVSAGRSAEADWRGHVRDFASLLSNVRDGSQPCLFVLDTFEEAQKRGSVAVSSLCAFLDILQEAVPRLRIVFAGRVPLSVDDFPTRPRPLGDFDDAAAHAFLERRGVRSPQLIRTIIKRVGKSPLSLLLAATVVQQARQSGEPEDLKLTGLRGAHLSEGQIQGYLYRRILNHIHDEEVRRLAYPGLVLRRLTPDIIQNVLAGPCKVAVPDEAAARDLFDRLGREVTLVQFEEGALVHRRDLRRIMLPLLLDSTEGGTARLIEDAAIRYYERMDGSVERAEEIYHRLSRHQPLSVIAERWTGDAGPLLFSALEPDELGARERAWLLSRLNPDQRLDDEESAAADLETWEWDTEQKVRELLERNRPAPALSSIRAGAERSPGSPLYKAEADILERMGRWKEARAVLEAGAESAGQTGDNGLLIDLLLRAAQLDLGLNDFTAAENKLDDTAELLQARGDQPRTLRLALIRFELGLRITNPAVAPEPTPVLRLFDAMSDDQLLEEPGLAVWTAALLGASEVRIARRVIQVLGLPMRPVQSRAVARAIAAWDDAVSRSVNRWKGSLGGEELPWADTLTQAWTKLLRDEAPAEVARRVAALLGRADPSSDVLAAIEGIMTERAAPYLSPAHLASPMVDVLARPLQATPRAPNDISAKLTARDAQELLDALLNAFHFRDELSAMVSNRLDRSVEAISLTDNMAGTVRRLVQAAAAEGWIAALVAAALESRPNNAALLQFAERYGLAAKAPELKSLAGVGQSSFDIAVWRAQLGALEARVCRVQVDIGSSTRQYGTGFLVGPDLVLTAYHLVSAAVEAPDGRRGITLLFDYKLLESGGIINSGTICRIRRKDWIAAARPSGPEADPDALDYALLRVEGSPGSEPIGGDRAEPGAEPRGWITVPGRPFGVVPGSPLFIAMHPLAGPLQVATSAEGSIGLDPTGTWLRYKVNTQPGSSGAPCFDANWELVAMHQRTQAGTGRGLATSAIVHDLRSQGRSGLLEHRLV